MKPIDVDNLPMKLISRYGMLPLEDAKQIAREAIVKAKRCYDPEVGPWAPYVFSKIRTALWTEGRKAKKDPLVKAISLDVKPWKASGTIDDEQENIQTAREIQAHLTEPEIALLRLRYEGCTYGEIAEAMGTDYYTAYGKVKSILNSVKCFLGEE